MNKLFVMAVAVLVALGVFASTASAHRFSTGRNCGQPAFGLACEGTLTDNEATWFAVAIYNQEHTWAATKSRLVGHRVNSSARCVQVAHNSYDADLSDVILVDIDYVAGVPYTYYATGYWGDERPSACFG